MIKFVISIVTPINMHRDHMDVYSLSSGGSKSIKYESFFLNRHTYIFSNIPKKERCHILSGFMQIRPSECARIFIRKFYVAYIVRDKTFSQFICLTEEWTLANPKIACNRLRFRYSSKMSNIWPNRIEYTYDRIQPRTKFVKLDKNRLRLISTTNSKARDH